MSLQMPLIGHITEVISQTIVVSIEPCSITCSRTEHGYVTFFAEMLSKFKLIRSIFYKLRQPESLIERTEISELLTILSSIEYLE